MGILHLRVLWQKLQEKKGFIFQVSCVATIIFLLMKSIPFLLNISTMLKRKLLCIYLSGPALVFEGEESMLQAISENPASFKVRSLLV